MDTDEPLKGKNADGKDIYGIKFVYKNGVDTTNVPIKQGIYLPPFQYQIPLTRENLISGDFGVFSNSNVALYCGALIQMDGWQIKDDNPCWK